MSEGGMILRAALGAILLALPLACGGDGYGGGPTDPGDGDGFSVSGTYLVTVEIEENTCGVDLPTQDTVQIIQEGSVITFSFGDLGSISGTFNTETGEFFIDVSITDPILGSLDVMEEGQFSSNSQYTSDVIVTFEEPGEGPCTIRTHDMGTRQ
ncbi:MAG: hypothetical protein ACRD3V_20120 [Vicinamibacteria bacterium]